MKDLSLTLYLTSTNKSVGALFTQEAERVEHLIYNLSKSLQGARMNYSLIDWNCLMLILLHRNSINTC